ncbi:autotransporter outer membrane beta-barrel domain-containing protein [Mesorhizobium sp. AR02]|uniref:autotransporter outer membrane beta-barrel domain-containing protein n=1 Tax=Mesorhizobium sp. AR02 TaxID=2865837 RepID=UPI002160FE3C|nr:autotransporter domain-containing protein [Mesorhizobium sp. AR02]
MNAPTSDVDIGVGSDGTLTVANGGAVTALHVLAGATSNGTINVYGTGSTLTAQSTLAVNGVSSGMAGTLSVTNGGTAISTDQTIIGGGAGSATATVDGAGSSLQTATILSVGILGGSGSLTISNGGAASAGTGAVLGNDAGSSGMLTVEDAHSTFTTDELGVGNAGTGTLTIKNGGTVLSQTGYVGIAAGSTGTALVTGAGSTWNSVVLFVGGYNDIGDSGSGTLTVSNGGSITTSYGEVGAAAGSTGDVTVDGTSSIWNDAKDLIIGYSGNGSLTIQNGGTVSSDNSFVGMEAGGTGKVFVTGTGSTWHTGNLFVGGDNNSSSDSGSGSLTIEKGAIVDNGGLTAIGYAAASTGTVTVTGAGSTLIGSGVLDVGDMGNGTLAIADGGAVTDTSGVIGLTSGIGAVTVVGANSNWTNPGDLYIGGGNGASGTVAISNGGSVSVGGNAYLGYGSGSTGTLTLSSGGAMSVSGNFLLANQSGSTATLNIGAAAGDAAVAPGTLDAASVSFGHGAGTINFNHTGSDYVFAPAILGVGTINQIAGNTELNTDSIGFAGDVNITGGRLAVNALLPGAVVTVSDGGTLGGTGVVGWIGAHSGGTVAPGNSIGTLNVAGDLLLAAGSIYQVQVNASGASDLILASGTADLTGGSVQVLAAPGTYGASTQYTILTAADGVNGSFAGVSGLSTTPFLSYGLTYDKNNVYLDVDRSSASFASVGATPNQIATGAGVESLGSGNTIDEAIVMLPTVAAVQEAFDQLSGEIHASTKGMLLDDSHFVRDAATSRIDAAFGDAGAAPLPVMAYGDGGPEMVAADTDRFAVWGQAFGSWGITDSDGNAATFDRSTGGLLAGADTLVGGWRVGVLGGYSHSSFDVDARNSTGASDNYHLGLYGGTNWGAIALRGGAAYSWSSLSTHRSVAFNGFTDGLSADYDAGTAQAFGELAYKIDANKFAFEPFANLAYVSVHTDGFTETGGAAALTSAGSTTDATFTTLGLRGSTDFALGGIDATARGMLGWRHAFGDVTPTSTFAFAGGDAFTIAGVPIARDAAVVEAGLDLKMSANATLGLSYSGQFGGGTTDNGAKANLSVKF